jgi:hypothetical protein
MAGRPLLRLTRTSGAETSACRRSAYMLVYICIPLYVVPYARFGIVSRSRQLQIEQRRADHPPAALRRYSCCLAARRLLTLQGRERGPADVPTRPTQLSASGARDADRSAEDGRALELGSSPRQRASDSGRAAQPRMSAYIFSRASRPAVRCSITMRSASSGCRFLIASTSR